MKTLVQLLAEVKESETLSTKDLSGVDRSVRSGWEAKKNAAIEMLGKLKEELNETLNLSGASIFISGPESVAEELAGVAEDEGNAITVRADELYHRIAKEVFPTMGANRVFGVPQAARLIEEVVSVAREFNLAEIPNPAVEKFVYGLTLNTYDEVLSFVRDSIRSSSGDELNLLYLKRKIANEVLKQDYEQNVVPVVVLGATPSEISGELSKKLFNGHTYSITAGNQADPNAVILVFNKIKAAALAKKAEAVTSSPELKKTRKKAITQFE